MSVLTPAEKSSTLELFAHAAALHEGNGDDKRILQPGWSAEWLAAMPSVTLTQKAVAHKFVQQLGDKKLRMSLAKVSCFNAQVRTHWNRAGLLPLGKFLDHLPIIALADQPKTVVDSLRSLMRVVEVQLFTMLDAATRLMTRGASTQDEYAFIDGLLDSVGDITPHMTALLDPNFKLQTDANAYAEHVGTIERAIADAFAALEFKSVTEASNADHGPILALLASGRHATMDDFVRHSAIETRLHMLGYAQARGLAATLLGIFSTAVLAYAATTLFGLYQTLLIFERLASDYAGGRTATLALGTPMFALQEAFNVNDVPVSVRYTQGWVKLTRVNFGLNSEPVVIRELMPPGFVDAQARFSASLLDHPATLIGAGGVVLVLVAVLLTLGFIRYNAVQEDAKARIPAPPPPPPLPPRPVITRPNLETDLPVSSRRSRRSGRRERGDPTESSET